MAKHVVMVDQGVTLEGTHYPCYADIEGKGAEFDALVEKGFVQEEPKANAGMPAAAIAAREAEAKAKAEAEAKAEADAKAAKKEKK